MPFYGEKCSVYDCLVCHFPYNTRYVFLPSLLQIFIGILSDVINITAVTIFGVEHRFDDGFTYGHAFWMVVCSTSVSTFTNITLIVDLVWTPDFANSGAFGSDLRRICL